MPGSTIKELLKCRGEDAILFGILSLKNDIFYENGL